MTRAERELARLLIADPVVRGLVQRAARVALAAAIGGTAVGALLLLWLGGAR